MVQSQINNLLNNMRRAGKMQDAKSKGDLGEDAVLSLIFERRERAGVGLIYQSYKYPYQSSRDDVIYTGNIKYENGSFFDVTSKGLFDEIDVLYITPFRVFPIEVKSYGNCKLKVYDHWLDRNSTKVDKSPVTQAEKHARHLYHAIHDVLPDGNPEYIVPLVCFVDKCKVVDSRSDKFRTYVPVCILNNLVAVINEYNKPLEYNLSLDNVENKLKNVQTSVRRRI